MRLTVLGKSPSWQDADGACSGYLIEEGQTAVLLDCGNGVFSKLRRYRDYGAIDAVVVSHLHADHFLDLVPYSYALTYAPRRQPVPIQRWPGADSKPNDDVVAFARGCHTLLIEATLPRPERTGMRGHLTPREAGEHARKAGVERVVLTHMSDELDELWARREGEAGFGGPVEI